MNKHRIFLGLDVGNKRVGMALGDAVGRVAQPLHTVATEDIMTIKQAIHEHNITDVVIGLPRNQAGDATVQTALVRQFAKHGLQPLGLPIHWQDESVTSVLAEERLSQRKKAYTKADIDAEAACIILQDYLEQL